MKIQSIDNSYNLNKQNFGMAIHATPEAKEFLAERLSPKGMKKFQQLQQKAANDIVDVNLNTETRHLTIGMSKASPYKQLLVTVGDDYFNSKAPDGSSFFIIRAIKKSVNKAHLLSENKKSINNMNL